MLARDSVNLARSFDISLIVLSSLGKGDLSFGGGIDSEPL
jgi:hypothetical protein